VADSGWLAVDWVEVSGASGEPCEFATGVLEFGDALLDLGGVLVDEVADVAAGGLSLVAEGDDLFDLAEGEPARLGGSDECESVQDRLGVVAVAVGVTIGGRQQSDGLVVADCLGWYFGAGRDLTDQHAARLRA